MTTTNDKMPIMQLIFNAWFLCTKLILKEGGHSKQWHVRQE